MAWLEAIEDGSRRVWFIVVIVVIMGVGAFVATVANLAARGIEFGTGGKVEFVHDCRVDFGSECRAANSGRPAPRTRTEAAPGPGREAPDPRPSPAHREGARPEVPVADLAGGDGPGLVSGLEPAQPARAATVGILGQLSSE